ncbi:metalloproteinase inhibitor 1 [Striga asiatica]|uniref:Metalloproteinase inhibitor 1 n=1 Tax=Striga asiatica TaxID=4170 RepID=A0A5A7QA64_STRAF|nr:metalloproteinase inhibitor 1 [Striga asiatica]
MGSPSRLSRARTALSLVGTAKAAARRFMRSSCTAFSCLSLSTLLSSDTWYLWDDSSESGSESESPGLESPPFCGRRTGNGANGLGIGAIGGMRGVVMTGGIKG